MNYFAYGSNLDPDQMKKRAPGHRPLGVARASGYRLAFTKWSGGWGGYVADMVADETSQVWGMLYNVTPSDIASLDKKEGGYKRGPITVCGKDGASYQAVAYFVTQRESEGAPSNKYL